LNPWFAFAKFALSLSPEWGKRMRYSLFRLSLLICLVASFAGQTSDWPRYRNADGNFSVLMPVDPKESVDGDGEMASHTIQAIADRVGYTVVYVKMPEDQTVDEANYKIYKENVIKGLPTCTVVTEQPAAPAVQGYVGRWYRMNCEISNAKLTFVGDLYWGKRHAYSVMGMFATGPSDPPSVKKFVDSFSVIDSSQ
jgi:hypothetical protein